MKKSVREILEEVYVVQDVCESKKETIDQALSDLADLVLAEKKHNAYDKRWNAACDHIAKLIKGE